MLISRPPRPALAPFVERLWATTPSGGEPHREIVLPTGSMHLAFRFSGPPLRVNDRDIGGCVHAVAGGARAEFYVRDVDPRSSSVGAQLLPGACELLFGVPASELAGRHVALEELWGNAAREARDRMGEIDDARRRLDSFESLLLSRLPRVRGLHPAVALALARFRNDEAVDVGDVVRETGYSHRRFVELFRGAIGMGPKVFARLTRFRRALDALPRARSWAVLALGAGYADQPHFNREFRSFAGLAPTLYRAIAPERPSHVPIAEGQLRSIRGRGRGAE